MENLDGKYFENVIAALKKEKERENFVVRENFHAELRDGLQKHIINMVEPSVHTADWVEWVLRNKFLFGGVPTLAVVALVAYNSLGWGNVVVPTNQIIPETQVSVMSSVDQGATQENSVIGDKLSVIEPENVQEEPVYGIKTFSADLVMPPDEILSRRFSVSAEMLNENNKNDIEITETPSYQFMEKTSVDAVKISAPDINVNSYYPWSDNSISQVPIRVFTGVLPVVKQPVSTNTSKPDYKGYSPQSTLPPVLGREEKSGQVVVEQTVTETPVDTAKYTQSDATVTQINNSGELGGQIQSTLPTVENIQTTQLTTSVPVTRGYMVQDVLGSQTLFINPVEEFAKVSDIKEVTRTQLTETQDRFVYEGANRNALVAVVSEELALFETPLSDDHYVVIEKILEGSYKATLFEKGKVSRIWIITEQRGVYRIVTEIVP